MFVKPSSAFVEKPSLVASSSGSAKNARYARLFPSTRKSSASRAGASSSWSSAPVSVFGIEPSLGRREQRAHELLERLARGRRDHGRAPRRERVLAPCRVGDGVDGVRLGGAPGPRAERARALVLVEEGDCVVDPRPPRARS